MQENSVKSLGQEDPLEKEWQPNPVFLPGESHGERSLVGYSPWGRKESDMTERLSLSSYSSKVRQLSVEFSSVAQSCLALQPHGLQQVRPTCPSPAPRVYSNSCASCWYCHPTIWSSVVPFSSCLQSFSASGPFPVSQFFTSGGQSIGASAEGLNPFQKGLSD